MSEDTKDRRDFLVKLGIGAGVVGIGVQAAASVRSLLPNVSYDAPTTVKLGPPEYFLLMVLAFCTVSAVLGHSTLRGMVSNWHAKR